VLLEETRGAKDPTTLDPTPPWARGHKGIPSIVVLDAVVRILREIRGDEVQPERCATDAKSVLNLWKALGRPPIQEFSDQVVTVARWAREADDPLAENDIRGTRRDGERWGPDRSRSVPTLCRHAAFGDRLAAAQRWAGPERDVGRPPVITSDPGPPVSRIRTPPRRLEAK
jgi:hypothetical protein